MGQRELDEFAVGLDGEGDARGPLVAKFLRCIRPRVAQAPRRIGFDNHAGVGHLAAPFERHRRADLPVGNDPGAPPVSLGERA
jgi:hypothetical protein